MVKNVLNNRSLIYLLSLLAFHTSFAQRLDSCTIYEKIKKIADKHRFTTMMYQAVFVNPQAQEYPSQPATKEEKIVNPYLKYSGKTIRKIIITTYDPFGHSVMDTIQKEVDFFQKLGNKAHVTTRHWVIDNNLLFKKSDTINALSISESERLLRQTVYVNDARIFITPVKKTDSVDVHVVVLDKWTINVPAEVTDISANATFKNDNFLGSGQQFQQYARLRKPGVMDYSGFYNIANIDHTYISSRLSYQADKDGTGLSLSFDRPFYSPLAKWAGGVNLYNTQRFNVYRDPKDDIEKRLNSINSGYDVWLGKNIKLNNTGSFFSESNNLIIAARYYANMYQKRPPTSIDVLRSNYNTNAFLGNVGYAVQQYYKDKFIYRFGANEDVPEGLILQFLYGGIKREFEPLKYYSGIEIARAKHFKYGYFSATISCGIFYNATMSNDITRNLRVNYFSDLFRLQKWYFRQFFNYNLVYGQNKPATEKTTLGSGEMYGFESRGLSGNTKTVLNSETVAYAPYNLVGFKFAPVLLIGAGMVSDAENKLFTSHLYQAYSLGLMVRNENLLSSTFQVSFGVYPLVPYSDTYLLKYNPVTSFTLRVRIFAVSRPDFISY